MFTELAATPKHILNNAKELVKFKGIVKQVESPVGGANP